MTAIASSTTYASAVAEATTYSRWILNHFRPHLKSPILEIGLGHGGFVGDLAALGAYIGLDIDPDAVSQAKRAYPNLPFVTADIEDRASLNQVGTVQTILCCNVLEHVSDDRRTITNLLALLQPGGELLIQVPAHSFLYNDLDRLAHHQRRYGRNALLALFSGQPAEVIRVDFFNPVGFFGWGLNNFIAHDNLESVGCNAQIRFFVRYLLPLSRLLSPLTRTFFGQSLMLVAKKR
ncbi:MAG: class I SAM-dependent methyltransferase [Magnetococcales bacterium]|nr:class I SAM-dependent methyltransferase [Magnetococcales bacterium]